MKSKTEKLEKKQSNLSNDTKSSNLKEVLLIIFVILCLCLAVTQYLYYKINNKNQNEMFMIRDVHKLKSTILPFLLNKISNYNIEGHVKIESTLDNMHVYGEVKGLVPGSIHAIHILEFSDLMNYKDFTEKTKMQHLTQDIFRHYNPLKVKHSCPVIEMNHVYHVGDLVSKNKFILNLH